MKKFVLLLFFFCLLLTGVFGSNNGIRAVLVGDGALSENALEKCNSRNPNIEHSLSFYFMDSFNQFLPPQQTVIESALLKDQRIEFKENKKELFEGKIESSCSFNSREELKIKAKIQGSAKEFTVPVFFKPAKIRAENPFGVEEFFLNSKIERIEFNLSLPDKSIPVKGDFKAILFSNDKNFAEKKLLFKEKKWIAEFNHTISMKNIQEKLHLKVIGTDQFGNSLSETFEVPLSRENPFFSIELKKPNATTFGFGQLVEFTAALQFKQGKTQEARLWIESSDKQIKKNLKKEGNHFTAIVKMPSEGKSDLNLLLFASMQVNGNEVVSFKEIKVNLSRKIGIEFVYPLPGRTVREKENKLKTRLFYPNKKPLDLPGVNAFLFVDGERHEVKLLLEEEKLIYYTQLPTELSGKHNLTLKLQPPFNGEKEISTEMIEPLNWFLVLIGLTTLGLGFFALYYLVKGKKSKKKEKTALKQRLKEIKREQKQARVNYFKRQLSEKEYRDRALELKQERDQILKKIKK